MPVPGSWKAGRGKGAVRLGKGLVCVSGSTLTGKLYSGED